MNEINTRPDFPLKACAKSMGSNISQH